MWIKVLVTTNQNLTFILNSAVDVSYCCSKQSAVGYNRWINKNHTKNKVTADILDKKCPKSDNRHGGLKLVPVSGKKKWMWCNGSYLKFQILTHFNKLL